MKHGFAAAALLSMPCIVHGSTQPIPFDKFLEDVAGAEYDQNSLVRDGAAFEEIRGHILGMYDGVKVTSSFADGDNLDYVFDCVTIESQPSIKAMNITTIASPPPSVDFNGIPNITVSPLCDPGSIPMKRLSLERLTQFQSLKHFFSKYGNHEGPAHKYAVYGQSTTNYGGVSILSAGDPPAAQYFSLSQHWYTSGNPVQTAECGIVHISAPAEVFIYRTNGGYQPGTGCYNLDCAGFVQTDSSVALGGPISPWGAEAMYSYQLYQGNWWFHFFGKNVGYFPAQQVYQGGPMTQAATELEYGGETCCGTPVYPPMGTGQWGTSGYGQAAYQRNVAYYATESTAAAPSLTPIEVDTTCYNYMLNSGGPADWGTYFFFGGPGGATCTGEVVV